MAIVGAVWHNSSSSTPAVAVGSLGVLQALPAELPEDGDRVDRHTLFEQDPDRVGDVRVLRH